MSEFRSALADALGPLYRIEREVRPVGEYRLFVASQSQNGTELLVKVLPAALSLGIDVCPESPTLCSIIATPQCWRSSICCSLDIDALLLSKASRSVPIPRHAGHRSATQRDLAPRRKSGALGKSGPLGPRPGCVEARASAPDGSERRCPCPPTKSTRTLSPFFPELPQIALRT